MSTEGLQENKPELGWSSYDPMPPHATTRRAANSAISSISVQQSPSLVQQNHGDSNSEASTSPINVSNGSTDGRQHIASDNINQHYISGTSETTNEIMTALNERSSSMQHTQVFQTGSIIIKTEEKDDSSIGEVTSGSILDSVAFNASKVFRSFSVFFTSKCPLHDK